MAGLVALTVLVLILAVLRLLIDRPPGGTVSLAWPDAAYAAYRYKPLIAGAIVGAGLAVAGTLLQALLRNPLASPFILGVSGGAGLGVMITLTVVYLTGRAASGRPLEDGAVSVAATTGPAMLGALITLLLVYLLGQRRGWLDPIAVLLIGVVMSTICGAGIMFCQHLVPTGIRGTFTVWLMGYIPESTAGSALLRRRRLHARWSAPGDGHGPGDGCRYARRRRSAKRGRRAGTPASVVVRVGRNAHRGDRGAGRSRRVRRPYRAARARLLLGPKHTMLVAGAALVGVALVVGSDVVRQVIDLGGGRMPIGIFTALVGGPAFIWLLLRERGRT